MENQDIEVGSIRSSTQKWFEFSKKVIPVFVGLVDRLPKAENERQIASGSLLVSTMHRFQSILTLCQIGHTDDARILLRVNLEAQYLLKLLNEEKNFIDEYKNAEYAETLNIYKSSRKAKGPETLKGIREEATREAIQELEEKVKELGARRLHTQDLAKRAKMLDDHLSIYAAQNSRVHHHWSNLERYFVVNAEASFEDLKTDTTNWDGVPLVLHTAVEQLFRAYSWTSEVYLASVSDKLAVLQEQWPSLDE